MTIRLAVLIFLLPVHSFAADTANFSSCQDIVAPLPPEIDTQKLVAIAEAEMKASNTPGAAVGVVRDGKLVWSKGLGVASVETKQPITADTLFRLGSTTKMCTAAVLVSLAEEGKLKLHDPVGNCVPGLHPAIAALTPHQLLSHSAGLTDESMMNGRQDDAALGDGVRRMDASWLFTGPGKIYSYSNPGYWLAGLACEELARKPYADVMRERLFQPLGMERTTLRPTLAMTWPLALGHEIRDRKPSIVRPQANNAATWPAGQIYSNVTDLSRLVTALMDGGKLDGNQFLPAAVVDKLTRPYVDRPGDESHYGYGLMVSTERGVRIWQHGGSRTGYGSTIRMAPDQRVAIIILTNRSASSLPKTAAAAMEMLLPFDHPPRPANESASPLSDKEMAELAGTYTNRRQTVELRLRDGKLLILRGGDEDGEPAGSARPVEKFGASHIGAAAAVGESAGNSPRLSYFIVRSPDGKPEYLITSGRALYRVPAKQP